MRLEEANEANTADQVGRTEQAPLPRRRTVLVVDDEPDMVENLARIFRRSPYACLTAASAQDALALLEREQPDLLLTDLRMPGVDGLTLVRHARRLAPATPVVIFTAFASDSAAREAIDAGAAAFLAKPFTAAQLLSTVQMALRSAGGGADSRPS